MKGNSHLLMESCAFDILEEIQLALLGRFHASSGTKQDKELRGGRCTLNMLVSIVYDELGRTTQLSVLTSSIGTIIGQPRGD
jgi:hypothetical protein